MISWSTRIRSAGGAIRIGVYSNTPQEPGLPSKLGEVWAWAVGGSAGAVAGGVGSGRVAKAIRPATAAPARKAAISDRGERRAGAEPSDAGCCGCLREPNVD